MSSKSLPKTAFVKAAFALMIAGAAVALLTPAFTATAERTVQQPKSSGPQQGIAAPMQPIRPVSVAVVNFAQLAEAERKKAELGLKQKPAVVEVPAPMTIPEPEEPVSELELKASAGAQLKSEGGGPLIPSPGPAASFLAQEDAAVTIPPDTTGAVGPDRIFVTLNGRYRIQNKTTGAAISTASISFFWSSLNPPPPSPSPTPAPVSGVGDPRVQYDPYNNRWILAAISNTPSSSNGQTGTSSSILVGISATSDPQGAFTLFRFVVGCAADPSGQTCNTSGEWADFPMLGFNKNWVAIGWNQFAVNGGLVAGKMLVLDYPALRAGTVTSNISTVTTAGNFCMHPATTYSSTEETLYVPVHLTSGSATYRLHKITGTPSAPVYTLDTASKVRPGGGWIQPAGDILPQTCVGTPGTTCPTTIRRIDSGDARIGSNVVFRNGNIWYAQTIGLPTAGLTHTAAQWTRIDTNGTFVDGGRVEDPNATAGSGEWYAYPSIAVNGNNDVLLGFSNFARTHFANAGYTFRAGTDAAGTMRDPVIIKAGEDYYAKTFGGTRNRWGDYSHTVVDPSNDLDMWTIQEYAAMRTVQDSQQVTSNSRWGTWWAVTNIGIPPPPPTPTPTPPPAPANDNFASAQTISACNGSVNGTNVGATKETGEPSHDPAGNPGGASAWYQWQAPTSSTVTIDTIGSNFDTLLAVYTGSAVNALTANAKDDDTGGNLTSSITFGAIAGTTYKIAVDGWAGDIGNIVLNWNQSNCTSATLFIEQNTDQLAAVDSVTFVRGPFTLTNDHNFSSDHRTRIIFFASDLGFAQATLNPDINTLAVVINGTSYPIESVGPSSTPPGSYVVFLIPNLAPNTTYPLSIKARGVTSANSPTITIVASPSSPASGASLSLFDALYPLIKLLL